MKKSAFHAVAGAFAMIIIATFWVSTLISEIFLNHEAIALVKSSIVSYGLIALVLMMASVGGSGFSLSKQRKGRLIDSKTKRMRIIAINAFVVMIPSAIFLNSKAASGEFDFTFYVVQAIELTVGMAQLTLMGLNFRDGLKMTGKLRKPT